MYLRCLVVLGLVSLLGVHCQAQASIRTWDNFIALVQKIEGHSSTKGQSLNVIANYIRRIAYSDSQWNWILTGSPSGALPNGILTSSERTTLYNMLKHSYSGNQEMGVVNTPFGDVAMGRVITGICAGLIRRRIYYKLDNLFMASFGGDLGRAAIARRVNPHGRWLGPSGYWTPSGQCPSAHIASLSPQSKASDAQIRGGIDGFLLGHMVQTWTSRGAVTLSQLLRMYYQDGVLFDREFAACRRINTFNNTINETYLVDQGYWAVYAIKTHNFDNPGNISYSEIAHYVNITVDYFNSYMTNYIANSNYKCPAPEDKACFLSANIIFVLDESGSIGSSNYQIEKDFVKSVIQELEISSYQVRVGVVEYASSAYETIQLGKYNAKSVLLCAVDALHYSGGGTATNLALETTYTILKNAQDRASPSQANDPQIVILLTDGQSNGGISSLYSVVNKLKTNIRGLVMIAVGVGSGVNHNELNLVATDPAHVFNTRDFSKLVSLAKQLNNETCDTPTLLKPEDTKNMSLSNGTKFTSYLVPNRPRYFKFVQPAFYKFENITLSFVPEFGSVDVYGSQIHVKPDENNHEYHFYVPAVSDKRNISDDDEIGHTVVLSAACQGNQSCQTWHFAAWGRNSTIGCYDQGCSYPNQIKVDIFVDRCPCRNRGSCFLTKNGYRCRCPQGFTGAMCQTNDDGLCVHSRPCQNGGSCVHYWYGNVCSCRKGFSGRYCQTNMMVDVTCNTAYMEIKLNRQSFPTIDGRNLHLNNKSCRATLTSSHWILRTPLNGCGTKNNETQSKFIFQNTVKNDHYYRNRSVVITRESSVLQPFHCEYSRRQLVSTSFQIANEVVPASEGNFGNFTFKMHICKAVDCQQTYIPSEYPVSVDLNQPLFIVYKVENTVKDLVVFAEKCLATNTNDPTSEPQHTFLDRGCSQDTTMTYNYNPASSVQYFSINSFRFLHTSSKLVYLHCQLLVCFRDSQDSRCAKGCLGKRKRRRRANDVYKDTSNAYDLSTGPVRSQNGIKNDFDQNKGSSDDNKTKRDMTIGLAVMGAVLAAVFAVVLVKFGCKSRTSAPKNMATSDGPAFANKGFDDPEDLNFKKVGESIG